jgi:hypothetical protein
MLEVTFETTDGDELAVNLVLMGAGKGKSFLPSPEKASVQDITLPKKRAYVDEAHRLPQLSTRAIQTVNETKTTN